MALELPDISSALCPRDRAAQVAQPAAATDPDRVLAIASAYGYEALVLGAWGCGAFGNDPACTASDFREALETDFSGHFRGYRVRSH